MLSRSDTTSSRGSSARAEPVYIKTLTGSQRCALEELRSWCVANDVYWHCKDDVKTNEDVTLLRYLRAREWRVSAAAKQYSSTVAWRKKIDLDKMYEDADIEQFEAISRLMPQWTGRRTRNGVPLFVYSIARTRPEDLLSTSKADPSLSSVFLAAEYSTRFVQPVCAALHPQGAMPVLAHIIDLNGVGVKHFWNMRAHLQKAAGMATSHYPESVDKIFIVGSPSFFPTIWGYITKWFDPAITSKISVLSDTKAKEVLTEHIDPTDIPRSLGGRLDWEYGMPPSFDAPIQSLLHSTGEDWVEGPVIFESTIDNEGTVDTGLLLAVGTGQNKQLRRLPIVNLQGTST